jgi:hypothetical protein
MRFEAEWVLGARELTEAVQDDLSRRTCERDQRKRRNYCDLFAGHGVPLGCVTSLRPTAGVQTPIPPRPTAQWESSARSGGYGGLHRAARVLWRLSSGKRTFAGQGRPVEMLSLVDAVHTSAHITNVSALSSSLSRRGVDHLG